MDDLYQEINQWSIKLENGEIYMIQRKNVSELFEAKEEYMAKILGTTKKDVVEPLASSQDHNCPLHHILMRERSFRGDTWFDHRKKEGEQWLMCKGEGWTTQ